MTYLTSAQKTQIRFHFSQVGIIYTEAHLLTDFDGIAYILSAISRCESAYSVTTLTAGALVDDASESVDQDIVTSTARVGSTTTTTYGDRVVVKRSRPSYRERISEYHRQVEGLARVVGVW